MPPAARPSATSLARLRAFRYLPALGGFGGDWDTLALELPFGGEAELGRLLAVLGHRGGVPEAGDLGVLQVEGVEVRAAVSWLRPGAAQVGAVTLTLAVYVTEADVARALRVEAALEASGIRLQDLEAPGRAGG
jgi:hypothetical protein